MDKTAIQYISKRETFLEPEMRDGYFVDAHMKAVWKVMLDIVEEFVRICNKYDLKYSLAGGTLIGAFRHRGFIPWDDDIDIDMVREEYDKFLAVAEKELEAPYFLQTTKTDHGRVSVFAQIRNSDTTCFDPKWQKLGSEFNCGIGIDIFPVDGKPTGKMRWLFTKWTVRVVQSIQYFATIKKNLGVKGFIKRYVAKVICAIVGFDNLYYLREWVMRRNSLKECTRCGELSYAITMRNPKLEWSSACYDSYIDVPFEYLMLKAAVGYDEMNTNQYGDWMTPVKCSGDHVDLFYDATKGYKEYLKEMKSEDIHKRN